MKNTSAVQRGEHAGSSPRCPPRRPASGTAACGSIGGRRAQFPADERDRRARARPRAWRRPRGLLQPAALPAHQSPHDAERGAGHQHEAGDVERGAARRALPGCGRATSGIDDEADRDVEPEDPLPGEALGDRAADDRAGDHREPGDAAEDPERRPARLGGNAALSSASASGITSAAPAPCTARAAISLPTLCASAHAAEAATNRPSPAANMRRRPNRSPSAAPVISSTAKLSCVGVDRPLQLLDRRVEVQPDRCSAPS